MSNFINNLVQIIVKKNRKIEKNYRYNYFDYYYKNIDELDNKTKNSLYSLIEKSTDDIDNKVIKDISYFLSTDISNESVIASTNNITNYVVFCLYMNLIDVKVRRSYFNKHIRINVLEKVRPDKYMCEVINCKNEFQFFAYAKTIVQLPLVYEFYSKIKKIGKTMPYLEIIDNMIIYEKPTILIPQKDPLIEVLKDVVNQLKNVNKHYMFEYIDKNSIGRSKNGLKRYFIFFLDSLINIKDKPLSHNVYDGRTKYDSITSRDQIRTVINILSEIYVTGNETYIQKTKVYPFNEYLAYLDNLQDDDIHNNFILYLMNIKK